MRDRRKKRLRGKQFAGLRGSDIIVRIIGARRAKQVGVVMAFSIDHAAQRHVPFALRHDLRKRRRPLRVRIGGERLQLFDGLLIAELFRLRERLRVADLFVANPVHHLPHADIGVEKIGAMRRHSQSQHAAPGMAHQKYLLLIISSLQICDHLFRIGLHAIDRHRRIEFAPGSRERLSRAALIPLHDREIVLPWPLPRPALGHHGRPGATVNEQQDRIVRVSATHADPLFDAADLNGLQFLDSTGGDGLRGRYRRTRGWHIGFRCRCRRSRHRHRYQEQARDGELGKGTHQSLHFASRETAVVYIL